MQKCVLVDFLELNETTYLALTCAGLEPDLADFTRFVCRGRSVGFFFFFPGRTINYETFRERAMRRCNGDSLFLRSPQTTMEIGMRFRSL